MISVVECLYIKNSQTQSLKKQRQTQNCRLTRYLYLIVELAICAAATATDDVEKLLRKRQPLSHSPNFFRGCFLFVNSPYHLQEAALGRFEQSRIVYDAGPSSRQEPWRTMFGIEDEVMTAVPVLCCLASAGPYCPAPLGLRGGQNVSRETRDGILHRNIDQLGMAL